MFYYANALDIIKSIISLYSIIFPLTFKNFDNKFMFINIKNLKRFLIIFINKEFFVVLFPTDKQLTSTQEIIRIVRKILDRKEKLVIMPNSLKMIIKTLFPSLHEKLFESLVVECNVYNLDHTLS